MKNIIKCSNVKKSFKIGKESIEILKGIDFNINYGDFVALVGESGSGKSTFLNILCGLIKASEGHIEMCNETIDKYSEEELTTFRRNNLGFIFQSYNLIPHLSALENVEMPLIFKGLPKKKRVEEAKAMLDRVGLSDRMHHKPAELSGGQQQRVSIARALVNKPTLVLADEPTGNLDSSTSEEILKLLKSLNTKEGITFIVVTHSDNVKTYSNKVIKMKDGLISDNEK